jgi:hypothetical protein
MFFKLLDGIHGAYLYALACFFAVPAFGGAISIVNGTDTDYALAAGITPFIMD